MDTIWVCSLILLSFCFDVLFLNYKLRSVYKIKKQIHWRKTGVHPTHTNIVIYTWISFLQSRGEVCTMAPLHLHDGMKDHPLYEQSLLALATLTKVQWIHSQLSTNQSNFFWWTVLWPSSMFVSSSQSAIKSVFQMVWKNIGTKLVKLKQNRIRLLQ